MSVSPPSYPKNCFLSKISPKTMALSIAVLSALALLAAFIAQYIFHLRPCELCIMQRIPFVMAIILGVWAYLSNSNRLPLLGGASVVFFVNAGIAFFHSGVERKWWAGFTGCTTPDMSGSIEELMQRIQNTAVVRCDEIPWSLFGLSMANYNVAFCLGLSVLCAAYVWTHIRLQGD